MPLRKKSQNASTSSLKNNKSVTSLKKGSSTSSISELKPWEEVQMRVYTNWVQDKLKTTELNISNLPKDLEDGLVLIRVMELLSGKKVPGKIHQKPSRSSHYSQNLAAVFSFMKEEEQLPIINISPAQIQKGSEREILSLVWQLILRYQITDAGHGSKSLLLDWLRKCLPEKDITNLSSDWRDGFLLSSLVNFCNSSLVIDHLWLDSDEALENVENAMKLAEVHFNIPMLLKPEDFTNEKPDENSVMTYLSYFCTGLDSPGQKMILDWIKEETGDDAITNLADDWVDGKKLGLLVHEHNDDLEEEEDNVQACKLVMEAAEKLLEIGMTLTPAQFSDRTLNPVLRMMYLMQFFFLTRHAKVDDLHVPKEAGYGSAVWLDISLPEGSTNQVDASVRGNVTGEVPTDVQLNDDGKYRIKFNAEIEDLYTLNVSVGRIRVKGSPFSIDLTPPNPESVYLADTVLPKKAGIPVILTLRAADTSRGKLTVEASGEDSGEVPYLVDIVSIIRYKVSFIPLQSESYTLDIRLDGMHVKGSPFVFPLNDLIQPEMVTIGEPVRGEVGEVVTIPIDTKEAGKDKLTATCSGKAAGVVKISYNPPDNPKEITFIPHVEDVYSVSVFFGNSEVVGSPFDVKIPLQPPRAEKVRLVQPPSGLLSSGHEIKLVFDGSEAGDGKITASCNGQHCGDVKTKVDEKIGNYWDVTFVPPESDIYEFNVFWSGKPIRGSPFNVNLIPKDTPDPAKCKLIGFPEPSTILLTNEVIVFQVDTRSAGKGYLDVVCRVQKEVVGEYEEDRVSMASTGTRGSEVTNMEIETEKDDELAPIREEEEILIKDVAAGGSKEDQQRQETEVASAQPSDDVTEKRDDTLGQPGENEEKEGLTAAEQASVEDHEELRAVAKLSIEPSEDDSRIYVVTYTPVEGGNCSVNVYWSDQPINGSPFSLKIYDPQLVQYNEPFSVPIKTAYKRKNLKVKIQKRNGSIIKHHVKMDKITTGDYILIFTPSQPDVYLMHVSAKNKPILGSPFIVKYFEPEEIVPATATGSRNSIEEPTSPVAEDPGDSSMEQVHVIRRTSKTEQPSSEAEYEAVHLRRSGRGAVASPDGAEATPVSKDESEGTIVGLGLEDYRFIVGTSSKFKFFCDDLGEGSFQFFCKPSTHADVVVTEEATEESTHWVDITPKKAGKCDLIVRYGGSDISGSPFTVNFLARGNATKCILLTPSDCPQNPNDAEKMFCVSTKGAGKGKVTAIMKSMSTNNEVTVKVDQHSKHHYHLKYVPTEGLNYLLTVRFDDIDISGSPYQILLGNPSHCKAEGKGLIQSWSGRQNKFAVDSINAGPGDLSVVIDKEGALELPKLKPNISKIENFKYEVDYKPESPGVYWITVKWNDTNIPGSPYGVVCKKPLSPDQLRVVNPAPVTYQGKPAEMTVAVDQVIEEGTKLLASLHSAEGVKYDGEVTKKDDQTYSVTVFPPELGQYTATFQWDGEDIVGSPFDITNVSPPLASDFSVEAVEKEMGLLSVKVAGPMLCFRYGELSTSVLNADTEVSDGEVPVEIEALSDQECAVNLKPSGDGEYILSIFYDNEHVKGSPFSLISTGAAQCYHEGHGLVASLVNQPNTFSVFTENGGPGELLVKIEAAVDGEGDMLLIPEVTPRDNNVYDVSYTPNFTGKYKISVLWGGGQDIPGSPFDVICCDPARYSISKPPVEGFLGKPIKIGVNEATLGPSYEKLEVYTRGKSRKHHAGEVIKGDDGNYLCTVQPPDLGKHVVHVQCNGYDIPGSPFKVHNMPNPIPEKVVVSGPGIEDGSIGKSGSFQIDVSEAGHGYINLKVQGPKRSFNVNLTQSKEDRRKIIAEYNPTYMGRYLISVLWSGVHVPNSPFDVNITENGSHRNDVEITETRAPLREEDGQTMEDAL